MKYKINETLYIRINYDYVPLLINSNIIISFNNKHYLSLFSSSFKKSSTSLSKSSVGGFLIVSSPIP